MAQLVITNNQNYTDIADAIRIKNGTNETYTPAEMPAAILALEAGSGGAIVNQNKTVNPSETQQSVTADSGYSGLGTVTVTAIPSDYVGTGVTQRTSSDVTVSGATVTIPTGYYGTAASKTVSSTTHPAPTVSVNTSSGLITASHTQSAGYVSGGTTSTELQLNTQEGTTITPTTSAQTAVAADTYTLGTVTIAAIQTETKTVTENGTVTPSSGKYLSSVTVNVPTGSTINNQNKTVTPTTNQQTVVADSGYTGLGTVTVNAVPTETKSITANGTYTPTTGKYFSSVTVNVPTVNISQDANGYIVLDDEGNYASSKEWTTENIAKRNYTGDIVLNITSGIVDYAFSGSGISSVSLPNYTERISNYVFQNCAQLVSFNAPLVQVVGANILKGCTSLTTINFPKLRQVNGSTFAGCTSLQMICLPDLGVYYPYAYSGTGPYFAQNCSSLTTVDLGIANNIGSQAFEGCSSLTTIILRKTTISALQNINAFNNSSLSSGGAGGTIYIPEVLYDHLGDGTSLDYKAATNWSTVDGYGTITWAKIEDSIYETQYADGTPIE